MNQNGYPIIIRGCLAFLLYARMSVVLFFLGIFALPFLPRTGMLLFYNFFLFLLLALIIIPVSFVPKCPYCNKAVLVTPIGGRHADLPKPEGIWQRWFGETINNFKSKRIPCVRCGKVSLI